MDKNLLTEFAGFSRDVFNLPLIGGVLRNLDSVLQQQSGGKGLTIYDELERDAQVFAVLQKRKMAVIQRPWLVQAADDSLRARKAADFVRGILDGMQFDRLCVDLLDALLKGFAVSEIIWELREGYLLPAEVIPRAQKRFTFDELHAPRLLTMSNMVAGEALPDRKFIVHSVGGKDGTPYGLGLGNRLYWPVTFKRQGIGFYLAYLDRFGSPTAVGKHEPTMPNDEVDKLFTALQGVGQESTITIPNTVLLELLEPKTGNVPYEPLVRYMDEQISTAVLGETMTTTSQAAGLGSGQAQVHNDVRTELAEADADLLSDTLNKTLIKWLVELNLGNVPLPRVVRDFSTQEDLKVRAERDEIVARMSGLKPSQQYITNTYGGEWIATDPLPITNEPPPAAARMTLPNAVALTAAPGIGADLSTAAAPAMTTLLDTIKSMVDAATDMDSLQAALMQMFGGASTAELTKIMEAGYLMAILKGMAEVQDAAP